MKEICRGCCGQHVGEVKEVYVVGWGDFKYCQNAIEIDRNKGLTVII